MAGHNRTNRCSRAEIKAGLDPAWSYVVIETPAVSGDAGGFDALSAILMEHADAIRAREVSRETRCGNRLMLFEVNPDRSEAVQRSLLGPRLPPSVTLFFYNYSLEGKTS